MNWHQRSYEKELLDREDIPFKDIRRNMEELNIINTRLGGHAITIKGLKTILAQALRASLPTFAGLGCPVGRATYAQPRHDKGSNDFAVTSEGEARSADGRPTGKVRMGTISVLEIGCGGGDNLRVLKQWAAKKNIPVQLTGVDINEACIQFARSQPHNAGIRFICSDYKAVSLQQDVIFSSLFCHHFTDDELVEMLKWMQCHSNFGFFINDLHRHPLAYYSIKLLTHLFSKSYLVKNDAPLSVQRGFVKREWTELFQKAMLQHYEIRWQWAFRWLITSIK